MCVAGRCLEDDGGPDAGDAEDGGMLDGGEGGVEPGDAGEAGVGDGGDGGVVPRDAGDAGMTDGGPRGCGLGELECMGVCVDGLSDPANCGACGNHCDVGEVCSDGVCGASCTPPRRICDGRCVDVTWNPDHCGSCGTVCSSGICIDGECSEPLAGHVVVIGHDYVMSRRGQNRLAGNAVFLARGSPVQVLVWEGQSTMASRSGTDAAIDQVATAIGRTWTRTAPTDSVEVPLRLATHDAFVIYAQAGEDDATLRSYGVKWQGALIEFLRRGGVVVLFDTQSPINAGTWQILAEAGLFTATGRVDTTGSVIIVSEPADAVALRVPLAYAGERTTVRFLSSDATVVTRDSMGPVVIHRTIVP
jgi:hypothetical protein